MKMQIGRITRDVWPHGRVTDAKRTTGVRSREMLPTELVDLSNAVLLRGGRVASRCGFVDRVATGKANPKWIAPFDTGKFFVYFETLPATFSFCEISTTSALLPSSAWAATQRDTLQQYGPAVPFNNEMCCLLGASIGAFAPATNVMTVLTSGGYPSAARFCCAHNDRMWFASDNYTIEYSQVGTFHTGAAFNSGGAFTLNDQYAKAHALASLDRDLFILCNRGIYILSGYSTSDFNLTKISDAHGIYDYSVQTVRVGKVAGIGDCVLFVNTSGQTCAVNRGGVTIIADKHSVLGSSATSVESAGYLPDFDIYVAGPDGWANNSMAAIYTGFAGSSAGRFRAPVGGWSWPGLASGSGKIVRLASMPLVNSLLETRHIQSLVWATNTGHVGLSRQVPQDNSLAFVADDYWIGASDEYYQVALSLQTGPENGGSKLRKVWTRAEVLVSSPAATGNWTFTKYFGQEMSTGTGVAVAPAAVASLDLGQTSSEAASLGLALYGSTASQATAWSHYLEVYEITLEYEGKAP